MPTNSRMQTLHPMNGDTAEIDEEIVRNDSESFGEFFTNEAEEFFEEDSPHAHGDESEEFWETAFPEDMEADPDWLEIHEAGFDHIDVARQAFPEIAEADDVEVEEFLFEITETMSPEELESFFKGLAKFGRKALRVAAPIVQKAAPIVGTAVGAAFGGVGAPIGGAIGSLLGSGVGALNQAVNAPGRGRSQPRRSQRRRSRSRRRGRRRMRRAIRAPRGRRHFRRRAGRRARRPNVAGSLTRLGTAAGSQVVRLLQNPQIQGALLNMAQRGVGAIVGSRGESISESAAIAGLIGGLELALQEAQQEGIDLDTFDGDFGPEDFASLEDAFQTLVNIVGDE
ncbi:MAG: hypothetical protein ACR2O3_12945 [Rhizobiaceae bacterium]